MQSKIPGHDPVYTMGYSEELIAFQKRFAEQESLNFVVSYLQPGQKLLDVGCGAGFLSARLAKAVSPGEMHGVDIEPSQVGLARQIATATDCDNATFQVADAMDLPFEDGSFDVVHLGGLLLHVPDTARALAEVKRVLRPGGMVASRDLMLESSFAHPELGVMRRSFEVLQDILDADEGHPQITRDIRVHLQQAGFTDIRIFGTFEIYDTSDKVDFFYNIVRGWFLQADVSHAAIEYGASSKGLLVQISRALEDWMQDPRAIAGVAFGHAVAVRP